MKTRHLSVTSPLKCASVPSIYTSRDTEIISRSLVWKFPLGCHDQFICEQSPVKNLPLPWVKSLQYLSKVKCALKNKGHGMQVPSCRIICWLWTLFEMNNTHMICKFGILNKYLLAGFSRLSTWPYTIHFASSLIMFLINSI